jgi:hypothetical protein
VVVDGIEPPFARRDLLVGIAQRSIRGYLVAGTPGGLVPVTKATSLRYRNLQSLHGTPVLSLGL